MAYNVMLELTWLTIWRWSLHGISKSLAYNMTL